MGRSPGKRSCFSGRAAHEIHTEDFAWDAGNDDPKNGGRSNRLCPKPRAGFYTSADADLWDGHLPAAHNGGAERWERTDGVVQAQRVSALGLSVHLAAAETPAVSDGDSTIHLAVLER